MQTTTPPTSLGFHKTIYFRNRLKIGLSMLLKQAHRIATVDNILYHTKPPVDNILLTDTCNCVCYVKFPSQELCIGQILVLWVLPYVHM